MCMPTYIASTTGKSTVGTQYNNGETHPSHGFNKCHISSILSIYSVHSWMIEMSSLMNMPSSIFLMQSEVKANDDRANRFVYYCQKEKCMQGLQYSLPPQLSQRKLLFFISLIFFQYVCYTTVLQYLSNKKELFYNDDKSREILQ